MLHVFDMVEQVREITGRERMPVRYIRRCEHLRAPGGRENGAAGRARAAGEDPKIPGGSG